MATSLEIGHERCRGMVCVVCYEKASRRTLSATDIDTVKKYVIDGYDIKNPDFPCGICTGCNIALSKKRKDSNFPLPNQVSDYNPQRRIGLRSSTTCSCKICYIGKLYGIEYLKHTRQHRKKRGRPSTKTPTTFKVCSNCFSKLYSGCSHAVEQCRYSRRIKVDNIIGLTSPSTLLRVASRNNQEDDASAIPLGRKQTKKEVRKELFTSDDLFEMKQSLQLSDAMLKVQDNNHRLDDYFEIRNLTYRRKDKETKVEKIFEQLTVVCNNLPELIDMILEKRGREWGENILIRLGIDGGGGFFKVCMSIFDKDDPYPSVKSGLSKKFKESGVKKVFLLALAPDVPENYVNVSGYG